MSLEGEGHLQESAKRKHTVWTQKFFSVYLWNSALARARPGVVQTNMSSPCPAHIVWVACRLGSRRGGPQHGGLCRGRTAQNTRQGVLTTMDSSLASPSQRRAAGEILRSHQRGWFLRAGEVPCAPRSTPPAIANCNHWAAIYRQSGLQGLMAFSLPSHQAFKCHLILRIRTRDLAQRNLFHVPSFPPLGPRRLLGFADRVKWNKTDGLRGCGRVGGTRGSRARGERVQGLREEGSRLHTILGTDWTLDRDRPGVGYSGSLTLFPPTPTGNLGNLSSLSARGWSQVWVIDCPGGRREGRAPLGGSSLAPSYPLLPSHCSWSFLSLEVGPFWGEGASWAHASIPWTRRDGAEREGLSSTAADRRNLCGNRSPDAQEEKA